MSWKTLNAILGLATVDEDFCQELLVNPLAAVRLHKFELTELEQETFKTISAKNLAEFSQQLVALIERTEQ